MNILLAALSLGVLGLIFGVLLGFAAKAFQVEVDPKIPRLRECLPGANCGACGFAGCDAYAEGIVIENARLNLCSVGGQAVADRISEIMGTEAEVLEKSTAFVKCNGNCNVAKEKYEIEGDHDCISASILIDGGSKACLYGCLGLGSCVSICEFGALDIIDGIAKVNIDKCTNCRACINICPKGLIESVKVNSITRVACNNTEIGKRVKANCSKACIGCKICQKNCPKEAIAVTNNLAEIDYEKCINCGICSSKCPTKAIILID